MTATDGPVRGVTNHTFDEVEIGASETITHRLSAIDVEALSTVAGDVDAVAPRARPGSSRKASGAPGATAVALISGILTRRLPGPGSAIVGTRLAYAGRLHVGDTLTATVTARAKHATGRLIDFDCRCVNERGEVLVEGVATVSAPTQRLAYSDIATPGVVLRHNDALARLLQACVGLEPVTLRHCSPLRPRLAAWRRRGGAAGADRAGAGRARSRRSARPRRRRVSTLRPSGSLRRRTVTPRRRPRWRWRAQARSRR